MDFFKGICFTLSVAPRPTSASLSHDFGHFPLPGPTVAALYPLPLRPTPAPRLCSPLRTLSLPSVASLSVPTSKLLCIKPCHFLASGLSQDVCFWFNSHLSPAVTCLHLPPGLRTLLICYFLSRFPVYPSLLASSCNLLTSCPCS